MSTHIASLQSSFAAMSGSLKQIAQQISDLKSNFLSFTMLALPTSSSSPPNDGSSVAKSPSSTQPAALYSSIVSKSFSASVKQAVSVSLRERDNLAQTNHQLSFTDCGSINVIAKISSRYSNLFQITVY